MAKKKHNKQQEIDETMSLSGEPTRPEEEVVENLKASPMEEVVVSASSVSDEAGEEVKTQETEADEELGAFIVPDTEEEKEAVAEEVEAKPKSSASQRIRALNDKNKEMAEKIQAQEKAIEELQAQAEAQMQEQQDREEWMREKGELPKGGALGAEPKLEDYDDYEEYRKDRLQFANGQRIKGRGAPVQTEPDESYVLPTDEEAQIEEVGRALEAAVIAESVGKNVDLEAFGKAVADAGIPMPIWAEVVKQERAAGLTAYIVRNEKWGQRLRGAQSMPQVSAILAECQSERKAKPKSTAESTDLTQGQASKESRKHSSGFQVQEVSDRVGYIISEDGRDLNKLRKWS